MKGKSSHLTAVAGHDYRSSNRDGAAKIEQRRVVLVDQQPIARESLAKLIDAEPDLVVEGQAANAAEGLAVIAEAKPNLAILDLHLEDSEGVDIVRRVAKKFPQLPVLVLSAHAEAKYAEHAIRAGARGYVEKRASWDELVIAIRRVLGGGIHLTEAIAHSILIRLKDQPDASKEAPSCDLSGRELELFALIGEGYGPSEIASRMRITVRTFESYSARIRVKLGLTDARELLRAAILRAKSHPH